MTDDQPATDDLRFWEYMAFFAYGIGVAGIGFYAADSGGVRTFAILTLVGSAAWLAGSTLGFLFGVPRVRASEAVVDPGAASIVPNTNLEQISDWLTKIIVGATLVQLGPLADGVARLSRHIGQALERSPTAVDGSVASGGVLVLFFASGFLWGYLWCSLRVFREMQALVRRERGIRRLESSQTE